MTLMTIVMEICFVDQTTALLGIAVKVVVAIHQIMTGLAALPPVHAALERDTVTLMKSVLEIWFVEVTTAVLGIMR